MEASSHARRAPFEEAETPPGDGHAVTAVAVVDPDGGWCVWVFDSVVADPGDGAGLRVNGAGPVEVSFSAGDDFVLCRYAPPPGAGDPWQLVPAVDGAPVTFPDGRPALAASGACVLG